MRTVSTSPFFFFATTLIWPYRETDPYFVIYSSKVLRCITI